MQKISYFRDALVKVRTRLGEKPLHIMRQRVQWRLFIYLFIYIDIFICTLPAVHVRGASERFRLGYEEGLAYGSSSCGSTYLVAWRRVVVCSGGKYVGLAPDVD